MLEFYQAYADYHDLMQLHGGDDRVRRPAGERDHIVEFNGNTIDLAKWQRLTMVEAIRRVLARGGGSKTGARGIRFAAGDAGQAHAGFGSLEQAAGETTRITPERLAELKTIREAVSCRLLRFQQGSADRQDSVHLFEAVVEPFLSIPSSSSTIRQ